MKIKVLYSVLGLCILLFSCEKKEQQDPGCDVNGIWVGHWESDTDDAGIFIADVAQNHTNFEGDVAIQALTPKIAGYYPYIEGTVKDKIIKVIFSVSNVSVLVDGIISNSQTVNGNFSVKSLQMKGTYSGEEISSSTVAPVKSFTISPPTSSEHIHDFLCVNDEFWFFIYPWEDIDGEGMYKTIITDLDGHVKREMYFPHPGFSFSYCYDGLYFWTIWNGNVLYKYGTTGDLLLKETLPFHVDDLFSDGQNLYFSYWDHSTIKTDMSLNVLDTIYFDYAFIPKFIYDNSYMTYATNKIYQSDREGKLQHVYDISGIDNCHKVVTSSDQVWILVGEEEEDPLIGRDFTIYNIDL